MWKMILAALWLLLMWAPGVTANPGEEPAVGGEVGAVEAVVSSQVDSGEVASACEQSSAMSVWKAMTLKPASSRLSTSCIS